MSIVFILLIFLCTVLCNYITAFVVLFCPIGLLSGYKYGEYIAGFKYIKYLEQSTIIKTPDKKIIKIGDSYVNKNSIRYLNKCSSGGKILYIKFRDIYIVMKDKKGMEVN